MPCLGIEVDDANAMQRKADIMPGLTSSQLLASQTAKLGQINHLDVAISGILQNRKEHLSTNRYGVPLDECTNLVQIGP